MTAGCCERCGCQLQVGDHPFCPHGRNGQHGRVTNEAFIGGLVIENLGDQPVTVYSRDELKLEMEKRGLDQRIKYVPGDHYLTNWALGIDAQTMENARALVSRPRGTSRPTGAEMGRLNTFRRAEPGPDIQPHPRSDL